MKKKKMNLNDRLKRHPELQQRVESLLDTVEDVEGDLDKANAIEERVIQELQQMGREAIKQWAEVKGVQYEKVQNQRVRLL